MKRYLVFFFTSILLFSSLGGFVLPAQADPATDATINRDQLEAQLRDIEAQIASLEKELSTTKTQKVALANKIKQLRTEQAKLRLQVQATTLVIQQLAQKISVTEQTIKATLTKTERLKLELGALFNILNTDTDNTLLSLFEANGLSGVFNRYENISQITASIASVVDDLKSTKQKLDTEQIRYTTQQGDAKQLLSVKTLQQQTLISTLGEESKLLADTQGKESEYQKIIADQQKQAAAIRNRIYELFESNKTVTFGQAVTIAQSVEKMTGVRAAFLLAILTQESSLGKNVGTCNRAGDPPEKSWTVIMKPDRDQEPFKAITSELGLAIDTTPVSCPMKGKNGKQIGWGGAMGPAQFIPSTWMGYRAQVTALTGNATANPWDIRDAFVAAGVKTGHDGATAVSGEWKAAMIYFSGGTNTAFRFYGDNVVATANKYQKDIDQLN